MTENTETPQENTGTPEVTPHLKTAGNLKLEEFNQKVFQIKAEIGKVIIGQDETVDLLLAGLFAGGHMLIEGVPGIAKTLTAKLLAKTLSVDFSRIQFTPDLMPTDVVGTQVFNMKTSEFYFRKGPVFSNIVLIDEINRAPAKTQAALFEVMEEQQITNDGTTYPLDFPFVIMATQNPVEQEGTYKLPEAQLDRFIFRIRLTYPSLEQEMQIVRRFSNDFEGTVKESLKPVMSVADLRTYRDLIQKVYIKDDLADYIARITNETRSHADLYLGASPRASLAVMRSAKAIAAMAGRDFVTPEDIQMVCYPVLNHRLILMPEREIEGITTDDVIKEIIQKIEIPR
ncbi:MAG: MoxR family ATPase [Bacteroidetes bacterium]|nr:MoxR family ATPase [Bacteroidota bacterium]